MQRGVTVNVHGRSEGASEEKPLHACKEQGVHAIHLQAGLSGRWKRAGTNEDNEALRSKGLAGRNIEPLD